MIGVLRTGFYDLSITLFYTANSTLFSSFYTEYFATVVVFVYPLLPAAYNCVQCVCSGCNFWNISTRNFFCARRSTFKIAGSGMITMVLFQSQDKKVKCVIFIILLLHVCIPLKFVQKVKVIPKLRSLNRKVMSRLNCKKTSINFKRFGDLCVADGTPSIERLSFCFMLFVPFILKSPPKAPQPQLPVATAERLHCSVSGE